MRIIGQYTLRPPAPTTNHHSRCLRRSTEKRSKHFMHIWLSFHSVRSTPLAVDSAIASTKLFNDLELASAVRESRRRGGGGGGEEANATDARSCSSHATNERVANSWREMGRQEIKDQQRSVCNGGGRTFSRPRCMVSSLEATSGKQSAHWPAMGEAF